MRLLITIVFSVIAVTCLLGVVGEQDKHKRTCITICFGISAALVLAVNIIGGVA